MKENRSNTSIPFEGFGFTTAEMFQKKSVKEPVKKCKGCPACSIEVRNLFACAHNLLVTPPSDCKFREKIDELRQAVRLMQPVIDKHFGDYPPSVPECAP